MSLSRSKSFAHGDDGDLAVSRAMGRAKAIDTPGLSRTDADTRTKVRTVGDAEAEASAEATATIDETGMSVQSGAATSAAVE